MMEFICQFCKKHFSAYPSHRKGPNIFCNNKCAKKYWLETRPQRFWAKVKKNPDGCWFWLGGKTGAGYGEFCKQLTHRFSYKLSNGENSLDDKTRVVIHKCDNRACVNPRHLTLGTQRDNIIDCSQKGRISHGEGRPQAKLKEVDVLEIRRLSSSKELSQVDIAKKFGVSPRNVYSIVNRLRWKHI